MADISAILLAAGESRRMGELNKLEVPVNGVPLVHRSARTLLAAGLQETVVVLGYEAERVRSLLEGLPVTSVFNPYYRQGQMTSVHEGLLALSRPCDGVMVCLSDLPLLEPEDLNRLIVAFEAQERGSVLVPTHEGRRGNPIVLAWEHRETILAAGPRLGCRRFIDENPHLVKTIEMETDHVVFDLDTAADYRALLARQSVEGQRSKARS